MREGDKKVVLVMKNKHINYRDMDMRAGEY
jgi:hypothetical protein